MKHVHHRGKPDAGPQPVLFLLRKIRNGNVGIQADGGLILGEHQQKIDECLAAALKWIDAFAAGDLDRVHRAILKFSNPKPEKKPDDKPRKGADEPSSEQKPAS